MRKSMPQYTGTTSEFAAERLLEAIRSIMEETGLPFGPAVDEYIRRKAETDLDKQRGT